MKTQIVFEDSGNGQSHLMVSTGPQHRIILLDGGVNGTAKERAAYEILSPIIDKIHIAQGLCAKVHKLVDDDKLTKSQRELISVIETLPV